MWPTTPTWIRVVGLANSVWIHVKGGGKAVVFPRGDGFAGESLETWFTKIAGQWHKATGRTAVRESRDIPAGAPKGT